MLEIYFHFSPIFQFIVSVAISSYFYRYTYVSTMILCIAPLIPHIFPISNQIPHIPTLVPRTRIPIPFLAFSPLFSVFHPFRSSIPYFDFYR